MFISATNTQTALDYLQNCLTSTNLQIVLLVGSGILAVGLLMLALTRWGHSRPVWKCVILSVIAHILLIAYAWGTHLIAPTQVDVVVESEPMRINFQEEIGDAAVENEPANQLQDVADWDQFSAQSPLPDEVELPRPEIDSELVVTKTESIAGAFELPPERELLSHPRKYVRRS